MTRPCSHCLRGRSLSGTTHAVAAAAVAFLAIVADASMLTVDRYQILPNDGIAFGSSRLGLATSSASAAGSVSRHRALLQRSSEDSSDSSKADEDSSEERESLRKRGSSSDAGDSSDTGRNSRLCTKIGGRVPSANYGLSIDGEKKERMETMYEQARRRCQDVSASRVCFKYQVHSLLPAHGLIGMAPLPCDVSNAGPCAPCGRLDHQSPEGT